MKDGSNFCVSVLKPWIVCPCFLIANTTVLAFKTLLFLFFPKSVLPNWECSLSTDAAYTWTFTVFISFGNGWVDMLPSFRISQTSWRDLDNLCNLGEMEDILPRLRRDLDSNKHHGKIFARSLQSRREISARSRLKFCTGGCCYKNTNPRTKIYFKQGLPLCYSRHS